MSFLPDTYEVPNKSNYTKLAQGETLLRILEQPILGYELWIDSKPRRFKMDEAIPMDVLNQGDVDKNTGVPRDPRHFWAMVVWNYETNQLQVWEITQKTIMTAIKALSRSKAWGSPLDYDLSISKEGEKLDTEYVVQPTPKKEVAPEILEAYKKAKIDVTALYTGDDPFQPQKDGNEASEPVVVPETQEVEDISDQIPF